MLFKRVHRDIPSHVQESSTTAPSNASVGANVSHAGTTDDGASAAQQLNLISASSLAPSMQQILLLKSTHAFKPTHTRVASFTPSCSLPLLPPLLPHEEIVRECTDSVRAATTPSTLLLNFTVPPSLNQSQQPFRYSKAQQLQVAAHVWQQKWREIALMQIPKHQEYVSIRSAMQQEHRSKLSQIISNEVCRIAQRQYRVLRDANLRGRRLVREVAAYWRKSEKESWENRRRAEREEIENRRRMNEQMEADRQKKKLEFLLTQTELYSVFIGRKMGVLDAATNKDAAPKSAAPGVDAANGDITATGPPSADGATDGAVAVKSEETKSMETDGGVVEDSSLKKSDAEMSELIAHASTVTNDENVTASDSARMYMRSQQLRAAEFDQLDKSAQAAGGASAMETEEEEEKEKLEAAQKLVDPNGAPPADDSLDLLNPSTMPQQESFVQAASSFNGTLKSYQLRGLNWLLNLYEQGINGILADEMGLGKTVQSIAFLSYLAGSKDIWGPFLIVAPNSTLHQWQQEVSKFCPELKILPYWGSAKERQILRQFWTSKQMYTKQAPFHVLITSYNVVVQDEKYFHRMRFMYMVLDEAQAIKNAASLRWKCLLNLKCRNRVLLTGTPIQNSMAELWALLHFIMPEFFGMGQNKNSVINQEDYERWFANDITNASASAANTGLEPSETQEKVGLDHRQVQRLHMILKPFMLRRVKSDVENEMPPKIEITLPCKLSASQQKIYKALQKKVFLAAEQAQLLTGTAKKSFLSNFSGPATFSTSDLAASDSLVTLVMQFRKVCNHPELYEKKHVLSPFYFGKSIYYPATKQKTGSNAATNVPSGAAGNNSTAAVGNAANATAATQLLVLRCPAGSLTANPISPVFPSLLHHAIRVPAREKVLHHTFNIFTASNVVHQLYGNGENQQGHKVSAWNTFSFLPFIDLSPMELEFITGCEPLHMWFIILVLQHRRKQAQIRLDMYGTQNCRNNNISLVLPYSALESTQGELELVDQVAEPSPNAFDPEPAPVPVSSENGEGAETTSSSSSALTTISAHESLLYSTKRSSARFCLAGNGFVWRDPSKHLSALALIKRMRRPCRPRVLASPAYPFWSRSIASSEAWVDLYAADYVGWEKSVLLGGESWKWSTYQSTRNRTGTTYPVSFNQSYDLLPQGLSSLHRKLYSCSSYSANQQLAIAQATQAAIRREEALAGAGHARVQYLLPAAVDPLTAPLYKNSIQPQSSLSRALHASNYASATIVPGLLQSVLPLGLPSSQLSVPTVEDLITDSGKLQALDELLTKLKREGHRVLIFSQMTKLIDLLESFLHYRRYKFARLDGQTALSERRDLVKKFQQDSTLFAFLLSTRAGGLGINLTAADTVIFYDNDWNPSSDSQAMDRVHRIGQTKTCTIYRLVCVNTVEERILIRAQQKHMIQTTVYAGGFKMMNQHSDKAELQDLFTGSELQQLLEPVDGTGGANNNKASTPINPSPVTVSASPTNESVSRKHKLAVDDELEPKRQKFEV